MKGAEFASRFLRSQRDKGRDLGPLCSVLEHIAGTKLEDQGTSAGQPGWQLSLEEIDKVGEQHTPIRCRTVHDFTSDLNARRSAKYEVPVPRMQFNFNPTATLTACLDTAECPETAREIFRVLFDLALQTVRARGFCQLNLFP